MKVDEFVTIYKLLTEQNYYTLPFCILAVYGLIELLFGFVRKRLSSKQNVFHGIIYAASLIFTLCLVINKRNYDEELRKDGLRIKQYFSQSASDYGELYFKSITNYFSPFEGGKINTNRIQEIANRFPNDFSVIPLSGSCDLLLKLEDTLFVGKNQRRLENFTYVKLLGSISPGFQEEVGSFSDTRLTQRLIEQVCSKHPDEFQLRDLNGKEYIMRMK